MLQAILAMFSLEGEDFLKIPPGARNGVENGLELLLDVEAFEYDPIIFFLQIFGLLFYKIVAGTPT